MNREYQSPAQFYEQLQAQFAGLLRERGILEQPVQISARALSPQEAIGETKRKDYPILTGKDVMVQASCGGALGQAFTDAPAAFSGTLQEICQLDVVHSSHDRGIFIAALNAVMKQLGLLECTVHCRNDGPERCAVDVAAEIRARYGCPQISLFGYQPSLLAQLSQEFPLRIADLNPDNIGQTRCGVQVEDGGDQAVQADLFAWADLVLCTGSTICNGTIVDFLPLGDKVLFYGTTLAGAAALMGLPRLCFADRYQ